MSFGFIGTKDVLNHFVNSSLSLDFVLWFYPSSRNFFNLALIFDVGDLRRQFGVQFSFMLARIDRRLSANPFGTIRGDEFFPKGAKYRHVALP